MEVSDFIFVEKKIVMKNIVAWWKGLDSSMKALIIIGIICIIGIILRWDYVVEGVKKGFNFYSETSE